MQVFPKQYKQIKNSATPPAHISSPFFFLPEQYSSGLHIDQLFRLFVLDTLHVIGFGTHLSEGYFLPLTTNDASNHAFCLAQKQLKKFGLSALMDGLQTPLDLAFKFELQDFFVRYFTTGTFFEDRFIAYRSNKYQTPVSGDFIQTLEKKKNRYTIKYFVSTKNNSLNVITDSPETIFGDVALAIHPQHKKAKILKGQQAIIPIINKTIPIIIDERADFTRYGGVYRVTPGHDKIGLEIAKDHHLPIDTYAIDGNGLFTENAGLFSEKPVKDFLSNIIQNLSDIGNMIAVEEVMGTLPVCTQTGELLIPHSWKGIFVKIPETNIDTFLAQEEIKALGISPEYITNFYWLASSCQKHGTPVPLRKTTQGVVALDIHWLYTMYKTSKANQGGALGLFIFFCISNKILSQTFSAEDFITMIFDHLGGDELDRLFAKFCEAIPETKKEFDGLLTLVHSLDKEKSFEKNIETVFSLLDMTFCLEKADHDTYRFAFEKLDPKMEGATHYEQNICPDFSTILLITRKTKESPDKLAFCTSQNFLKTAIKDIVFTEHHLGKSFLEKLHILPSLKTEKESNHFPLADLTLTKSYHIDCIRLTFLSLSDGKHIYNADLFDEWDHAIAKFWNACRYIRTTFFDGSKALPYKTNQKYIESNLSDLSAFDSWILSKLANLIEEYKQVYGPEQLGTFVHSVFDFIQQDFSGKYLELIKAAPSDHSQQVCLCVVGTLTTLLKPYLPTITNELSTLFGFGDIHDTVGLLASFESIQKNYSISLFMEIIDTFIEIKTGLAFKKHDKVSIFIRSNPDFIKFAKCNEPLLKKTLNADEIIYLIHHEEVPCGYTKEDIIDISIGLKALPKLGISGIQLLQKQVREKEEYLQYLKNLVQQLSSSGADMEVIQAKKKEISTIKDTIENLNFEISTCKAK